MTISEARQENASIRASRILALDLAQENHRKREGKGNTCKQPFPKGMIQCISIRYIKH
jgi:hypothetical protein